MGDTLYPGSQQVAPMKYCGNPNATKVDAVMNSPEWIMQQKYDGAWYQLEKTDDGKIYLFGRTMSKVTGEYTEKIANLPWLEEWAQNLPNGTTLIGEVYIPGGHSNDVTKIMGCLPKKAIERQKDIHVQYMVFDCIRYAGEDLCNTDFGSRFTKIEYYLLDLFKRNSSFDGLCEENPHVKIAATWSLHGLYGEQCSSFSDKLNEIFLKGGEGAVFKHAESLYRPGMRTTVSQSFKVKEHIDSVDLIVMDVLDPEKIYTGKEIDSWPYWIDGEPVTKPYYYGWKNALKLGAYSDEGNLVEVCRVASGLTDEIRADLGFDSDSFLGSVAEISCMSLNRKDKTIRHPVFVRFRDDKSDLDCKLSEIF